MEQQNLIQRLKECEEMPLFREVLIGETTFKEEVEIFYGYTSWYEYGFRGGRSLNFTFQNKKRRKKEEYPTDLVLIMNKVTNPLLDIKKLKYEEVIDDYFIWESKQKFADLLVGASVLPLIISLLIFAKNDMDITGAIGTMCSSSLMCYGIKSKPKKNYNYFEFKKLYSSAIYLDQIIPQYNKEYFKEKFKT